MANNGVDAAHMYGAFKAVMMTVCDEFRTPYVGIHVGTIKKSFTGKGNAPKEKVIAQCRVLGYTPQDDNVADAIATVTTGFNLHG